MDKTIYSTISVRNLDSIAINEYKIPGFTLMSRAGKFTFEIIKKEWSELKTINILCGIGNNGGDGFIVAKEAFGSGYNVKVILCGDHTKIKGDAKTAYDAYMNVIGKTNNGNILYWEEFKKDFSEIKMAQEAKKSENTESTESTKNTEQTEILVDALFGTGLNKDLDKYWMEIVNFINNNFINAKKIAIDVPSGLNANTGAIMNAAIKVDQTVTFVGLKQGLYTAMARDYCGKITLYDLKIPNKIYSKVKPSGYLLNLDHLKKNAFPKKISNCANKGHFGHVLIIGGNVGMLGASILAADAALRAGAGLVSVATRKEHAKSIPINTPEVMSIGMYDINEIEPLIQKATAILIGPGLGQDKWSKEIFSSILKLKLQKPLIIDADGINLLASMEEFKNYHNNNSILTPHPKEASRLLQTTTKEIETDRFKSAKNLHDKYKANIVLKGAGTIIFGEDEKYYITTAGNYGMASAGFGDILAGIIVGLVARGVSLIESAKLGVHVHAIASDKEITKGKKGMIATDILPWVRLLLN